MAALWSHGSTVSGSQGKAVSNVGQTLDTLLTQFAADWYRPIMSTCGDLSNRPPHLEDTSTVGLDQMAPCPPQAGPVISQDAINRRFN